MSGAVKGKGVIMKKGTCIEFDEKMTDLMQQIEDLNAVKVGLFCNREKMKSEDYVKQLDDVTYELLAQYSTLFALINIEKDVSNNCKEYIEMTKDSYSEIIETLTCIRKKYNQFSLDMHFCNKHMVDISEVDQECLPYYKKIVNLIIMCVDLEAENDN